MFGTFVEVGGASYSANQKAKAVCKVRDMTGVSHNVHVYQGKGFLPGPQNINQRYEFTLSTFQGSYQGQPYTGYSGFWNGQAQNAPQQQQAPQQAPQGPQQQAQQPKQANGSADMIKARSMGLAYAKDLVVADASLDLDTLFPLAEQCTAFIVSGTVPPMQVPGTWSPDDLPEGAPAGEETPWES
jgi:hypothetical protein